MTIANYRPTASTLPRSCPVLLEQRRHPTLDMALRLAVTDRLRLDVTMTGRDEIFSWSGRAVSMTRPSII